MWWCVLSKLYYLLNIFTFDYLAVCLGRAASASVFLHFYREVTCVASVDIISAIKDPFAGIWFSWKSETSQPWRKECSAHTWSFISERQLMKPANKSCDFSQRWPSPRQWEACCRLKQGSIVSIIEYIQKLSEQCICICTHKMQSDKVPKKVNPVFYHHILPSILLPCLQHR